MIGFKITYVNKPSQLLTDIMICANNKEVRGKAVWDTGATNTMITSRVIMALELTAVEEGRINSPSGPETICGYRVDISLPSSKVIHDIVAFAFNINDGNIIALIGMDIINKGNFHLTPTGNGTIFEFAI